MIFYSRENGRDGEKDYIDTDDFKDVYFEKEVFTYLKNGTEYKSSIEFMLEYNPGDNDVILKGALSDLNYTVTESTAINPVDMVEQGAVAYYEEELLDNIEVIKRAKTTILDKIKNTLLEDDCLLKGTNVDVLGTIKNLGNTIAIIDDITIVDQTTIKASKFYSIVNIDTIGAGVVEILLSDKKVIEGQVNSISTNRNEITIVLYDMHTKANTTEIEYKKSSSFNNIEEYHEDRAHFINIDSATEEDFDEFDDLF